MTRRSERSRRDDCLVNFCLSSISSQSISAPRVQHLTRTSSFLYLRYSSVFFSFYFYSILIPKTSPEDARASSTEEASTGCLPITYTTVRAIDATTAVSNTNTMGYEHRSTLPRLEVTATTAVAVATA